MLLSNNKFSTLQHKDTKKTAPYSTKILKKQSHQQTTKKFFLDPAADPPPDPTIKTIYIFE